MNKDACVINFTGLTHDHNSMECGGREAEADQLCSAISILKRHPMYDCLLLVKKYRSCLAGFALEFPVDTIRDNERLPTNERLARQEQEQQQQQRPTEPPRAGATRSACGQQRLVSRFLDGDDPIYSAAASDDNQENSRRDEEQRQEPEPEPQQTRAARGSATAPFRTQVDDSGHKCELVHVPVNGLLDRLENYSRSGVAVDSRVYAFAMGLKTAERMITTKSLKEIQETPI